MSEQQEVEHVLEGLALPSEVQKHFVELDEDAHGSPSVWLWFVIADEAWNDAWAQVEATKLRQTVRQALVDAGITRWPYVRFVTKSENESRHP
jgi:hypothetical protein